MLPILSMAMLALRQTRAQCTARSFRLKLVDYSVQTLRLSVAANPQNQPCPLTAATAARLTIVSFPISLAMRRNRPCSLKRPRNIEPNRVAWDHDCTPKHGQCQPDTPDTRPNRWVQDDKSKLDSPNIHLHVVSHGLCSCQPLPPACKTASRGNANPLGNPTLAIEGARATAYPTASRL
jgi:hypothetical protein